MRNGQTSDIIERLKAALPPIESVITLMKKSANESCAPCPMCGGTDRFYYKFREKRWYCRQCNPKGGDIIDLHCHLNGTDVKGLLQLYGILEGNGKPRLVETYDYTDAAGNLVHQTLRFEPGKNGAKKSFSQRRPDGKGDYIYNLQGIDTVLLSATRCHQGR